MSPLALSATRLLFCYALARASPCQSTYSSKASSHGPCKPTGVHFYTLMRKKRPPSMAASTEKLPLAAGCILLFDKLPPTS